MASHGRRRRENRKCGASSFYTRGVPLAMPSRKRERVRVFFFFFVVTR
jgi:hypothetical protein